LSTISIHCPHCGSTTTNEIRPDNYQCKSCQTNFNFIRPNDNVVTKDVRTHNCPECGRAVQAGLGNRCKSCMTMDLCEKCVQENSNGGLICQNCINKEQLDCYRCRALSKFVCVSCKNLKSKGKVKNFIRACHEHSKNAFWIFVGKDDSNFDWYVTWRCVNCDGVVCKDCIVKEKGYWKRKKRYCLNCNNELVNDGRFMAN